MGGSRRWGEETSEVYWECGNPRCTIEEQVNVTGNYSKGVCNRITRLNFLLEAAKYRIDDVKDKNLYVRDLGEALQKQ